jgi:hypothetical protein
LEALRELYVQYALERLQVGKEALMLLPFLETTDTVRAHLTEKGINIQEHQRDGALAVIDSYKWFFGSDNNPDEYMSKFFVDLKKFDRQGASIVRDLGAFFIREQDMQLVGMETAFPSKANPFTKMICCMNRADFDRLVPAHKELIVASHHKAMGITSSTQSIIFEEALAQSVNEAMSIYGRQVSQVLMEYLEKQHSIPPETLAENPRALEDALKNVLDSGARIVERKILRELYKKIGSAAPEAPVGDFEQKIFEVKKMYQKYYQ